MYHRETNFPSYICVPVVQVPLHADLRLHPPRLSFRPMPRLLRPVPSTSPSPRLTGTRLPASTTPPPPIKTAPTPSAYEEEELREGPSTKALQDIVGT